MIALIKLFLLNKYYIIGVLKNDVLAFVPGDCQMLKTKKTCLKSVVGVKCVWDNKKESCRVISHDDHGTTGVDVCDAAWALQVKKKPLNWMQQGTRLPTATGTFQGCVWKWLV